MHYNIFIHNRISYTYYEHTIFHLTNLDFLLLYFHITNNVCLHKFIQNSLFLSKLTIFLKYTLINRQLKCFCRLQVMAYLSKLCYGAWMKYTAKSSG